MRSPAGSGSPRQHQCAGKSVLMAVRCVSEQNTWDLQAQAVQLQCSFQGGRQPTPVLMTSAGWTNSVPIINSV